MKTYNFTVNGKPVTRDADSMRKAMASLKAELLSSLPRECTSCHPLVLKAYGSGDYCPYAINGWALYWPNGQQKPKARRTAEFRVQQ